MVDERGAEFGWRFEAPDGVRVGAKAEAEGETRSKQAHRHTHTSRL